MSRHTIVILIRLCFYLILGVESQTCLNGTKCPDYLPFCTPVGCVFKCPDDSFINGSSCVANCNGGFIYNKTCVSTCPVDNELIEDEIVFQSDVFVKRRYCLSHCRDNMYNYNGTCVRSCPSVTNFIDNKTCKEKCPSTKTLRRTITLDNQLLGIECLSTCGNSTDALFQQENQCVEKCNDVYVVFDGKCLVQCPNEAPISTEKKVCAELGTCDADWPVQVYCSRSCPEGYFTFNHTCTDSCPLYAKYGSLCLTQCPQNTVEVNDTKSYGVICVDHCPNYWNNGSCVYSCPKFVSYETGVDSNRYFYEKHCVDECVNTTCLADDGKTCVKECKYDPSTFSFVHRCPENKPFLQIQASPADGREVCVSACEHDQVVENLTCINVADCNRAVLSSGRCEDQCPEGKLYLLIIPANKNEFKSNNVTKHWYRYNANDLLQDPCTPKAQEIGLIFASGVFFVMYGLFMCFFLSTKPLPFKDCRKKATRIHQQFRGRMRKSQRIQRFQGNYSVHDEATTLITTNEITPDVEIVDDDVPFFGVGKHKV